MEDWIDRLLAGGVVEFSWRGKEYLIQQENNKGWDYLSLWRTAPDSVCLSRVFFDIFDGVSEETVRELCGGSCLEGHTVLEILQEKNGE